jgi:hypothetical protein
LRAGSVFSLHRLWAGISGLDLAEVTGLMAQLLARINLRLAMTSLLPYRLHAIWLNMVPIERQMRQSVKLFADKFLILIQKIRALKQKQDIEQFLSILN